MMSKNKTIGPENIVKCEKV